MTQPEFSRPVRLGPDRRDITLEANEAERGALARRFGILGIGALTATLRLEPEAGGSVRARGRLSARVEQLCVVTLEPVAQRVEVAMDLRILGEGEEPADEDPDSPDEIESLGGVVDLGEAVAEQLALALDPYPRAEGATLPPLDDEAPEGGSQAAPARPNPFAGLAKLREG
ncbi:YceD family protein [Falsiroseomonas sp.]|uniref:YceD family protein n=1 Tax=Falsiroseomonas sp. TaxID=2870721 RepID=UPI0035679E08